MSAKGGCVVALVAGFALVALALDFEEGILFFVLVSVAIDIMNGIDDGDEIL